MFSDLALSGTIRIAVLVGVFALVSVAVVLIYSILSKRAAVQSRLDEMQHGVVSGSGADTLRADALNSGWTRLADAIEKRGVSLVDTRSESLRSKLIAAGYRSPAAPRIFTLTRLTLTLGLPMIFVLLTLSSGTPPSLLKLYLVGLVLALVGLFLPNLWVRAQADRREQKIVNGFPDSLDLMLVCVEAGLGLEAAFDRVGREMAISCPLVSEILCLAVLELRAGKSREETLRMMGERNQIDDIRSFTTLLIQSDSLGSSIGTTLRIYATEMREKRRMRAEEKAHRLPVLLSVPLVACMLPVMIGVLMLPAAIRVIREIAPALAG
ncbi:type II secretion system F family protein [Sphingorhabdus sp. SMR4y]|uniref:type II secretion system F family protein n=1 Tax=Sphingorhabdus sp. SMR4y TaxID=2584094 RepID=UPI000B5CD8E8|nr:type II secretion system F family protein [Sphingorhabdus sp. SMR4y]ASK88420.1 type II secretion system (T2SS), protein F [Sphingorhabdus sp. SMR4y]